MKEFFNLLNRKNLITILFLGILLLASQGLTGTVYADDCGKAGACVDDGKPNADFGSRCHFACHKNSDGITCWGGGYEGTCSCDANFKEDKGHQTPSLSDQCVSCIAGKRAAVIATLKSSMGANQYGQNTYRDCSDKSMLNYWCNGGAGTEGTGGCNDIKNGDCASECNGTPTPPTPPTATIQGKVLNASGTVGVGGVKVWVNDQLGSLSYPGGGKYQSVITGTDGSFSATVTVGANGYWVRIPDKATTELGVDGAANFAIFIAKQTFPNKTDSQSYERQPYTGTDKGCWTQCDFTVNSFSTIGGKVVNASGTPVSGVKVWIHDQSSSSSSYAGGRYKSVTTGTDGRFSASVAVGTGYFVRIPDQTSLGADGESNVAIFTSKQPTKTPYANTASQSYEAQPYDNISHGCWNDCNFTVQPLGSSFPTKVRIAGSEDGLLLSGVYEHEFSGQYTPSSPLVIDWSLNDLPGQEQKVYMQFGFGTGSNFQWDTATTHTYASNAVTYNPGTGNCGCNVNSCTTNCQFTKLPISSTISYSEPIKCSLNANLSNTVPNQTDKNSWCNRIKRTLGDANGATNGGDVPVVDAIDYTYYLRAVIGGKIPPNVNPDFNGDGAVGVTETGSDLTVWQQGRGQ